MPTRNAKHVLILSEALDIGRFEAGTGGEQEFSLIEKGRDGDKQLVHHFVRADKVRLPLSDQ